MSKNSKPKRSPKNGKQRKAPSAQAKREQKASVPMAVGASMRTSAPRINGKNSFTIAHREYLETITAVTSDVFQPTTYTIQPASLSNFPWLNQVARNFEEYRVKRIAYVYKTRCATLTAGRVVVVTTKDSGDNQFGDAGEMLNYQGAEDFAVWKDWKHDCMLRLGDYMKKYFCITDENSPGDNPQVYNVGKFTFIANVGGITPVVVGDLFVEYEIELFIPKAQGQNAESLTFQAQYEGDTLNNPLQTKDYVATTFDAKSGTVGESPFLKHFAAQFAVRIHVPLPGKYLVVADVNIIDVKDSGINPMFVDSSTNCSVTVQDQVQEYVSLGGVGYTDSLSVFYVTVGAQHPVDPADRYVTISWNDDAGVSTITTNIIATLVNPATNVALTLESLFVAQASGKPVPPMYLQDKRRARAHPVEWKENHMEEKLRRRAKSPGKALSAVRPRPRAEPASSDEGIELTDVSGWSRVSTPART